MLEFKFKEKFKEFEFKVRDLNSKKNLLELLVDSRQSESVSENGKCVTKHEIVDVHNCFMKCD